MKRWSSLRQTNESFTLTLPPRQDFEALTVVQLGLHILLIGLRAHQHADDTGNTIQHSAFSISARPAFHNPKYSLNTLLDLSLLDYIPSVSDPELHVPIVHVLARLLLFRAPVQDTKPTSCCLAILYEFVFI